MPGVWEIGMSGINVGEFISDKILNKLFCWVHPRSYLK